MQIGNTAAFPTGPCAIIWLRKFEETNEFYTLYGARVDYAKLHHAVQLPSDAVRCRLYLFPYAGPNFGNPIWLGAGIATDDNPYPTLRYGLTSSTKGTFGTFTNSHLQTWHKRWWYFLSNGEPTAFNYVISWMTS